MDLAQEILEALDALDVWLEAVAEGDREDLEQVAQALAGDAHVVKLGDCVRALHDPVVVPDLVDAHGEDAVGVGPEALVGVEALDRARLGHQAWADGASSSTETPVCSSTQRSNSGLNPS